MTTNPKAAGVMGESVREPNRTEMWKDNYEVPVGDDRCPAMFGNTQCKRWKNHPSQYHWALGGNVEWKDGEYSIFAQPHEKVAADEEPDMIEQTISNWAEDAHRRATDEEKRPIQLQECMAHYGESFLYVTNLESSLASSAARVEEQEKHIELLLRLRANKYCPWQSAGGPNECSHGIAAGIDCRICDEIAERELAKSKAVK